MDDRNNTDRQQTDRKVSRGTVSRATAGTGRQTTAVQKQQKNVRAGGTQRTNSSASRPSSGQKSHISAGRPQTASSSRGKTSAGKSVDKRPDTRHRQNHTGTTRTNTKKKGNNGYQLDARKVISAAAILGVVLALIITAIMRAGMLRVRQIESEYEIGDIFSINNFFEPVSDNAKVTYDGEFHPGKLGKCTVKFKVTRGKMSKTKKGKINVVDSVSPYIDGPDDITVSVGDEINWSDYYNVTDSDPDIQSALKSTTDVDTSKVNIVNTILTVTDWAGNTSTKTVKVNIVNE